MHYFEKVRGQVTKMGLNWPDDVRVFPVDKETISGRPVFRYSMLAMSKRMKATGNTNPQLWQHVYLADAVRFRDSLIGYIFPDGEIRWDAEFIIHSGIQGRSKVEIPVHVIMYAPTYPKHLRKHLAYEKHLRSTDQKRLVIATH